MGTSYWVLTSLAHLIGHCNHVINCLRNGGYRKPPHVDRVGLTLNFRSILFKLLSLLRPKSRVVISGNRRDQCCIANTGNVTCALQLEKARTRITHSCSLPYSIQDRKVKHGISAKVSKFHHLPPLYKSPALAKVR